MICAEVETDTEVHGYEFDDHEDLQGIEQYVLQAHAEWERITVYRVRELRDVTTGAVRRTPPAVIFERVA
jgi:hypothetical protein